jgi:hypothetical protein
MHLGLALLLLGLAWLGLAWLGLTLAKPMKWYANN